MRTSPNQQRLRGRAGVAQRRRVRVRDGYTCAACGRVCAELQIDHVVALVNGGTNTDDNLRALCPECHVAKTRRDLGLRDRPGCDARGNPVGGWAA